MLLRDENRRCEVFSSSAGIMMPPPSEESMSVILSGRLPDQQISEVFEEPVKSFVRSTGVTVNVSSPDSWVIDVPDLGRV